MMAPGFISAKKSFIGEKTLTELSAVLVKFIYPCLIISSITGNFTSAELTELWFLPVSCFGIMLFGYLAGLVLRRFLFFKDDEERKAFHFQCTMNNYSFVPLPIALALYGEKGAGAVIVASLGAELALWTIGIASLKGFSVNKESIKKFFVPPLLALYFSVGFVVVSSRTGTDINKFLSNPILEKVMSAITMIGAATIPLAMVVCGARMGLVPARKITHGKVLLLTFVRLVALPIAMILIIRCLPFDKLYLNVLMIVAVMPTAVASILMSELYGGDKDFMTATVLTTHLVSLITAPVILSFSLL
jgi:predicted permease